MDLLKLKRSLLAQPNPCNEDGDGGAGGSMGASSQSTGLGGSAGNPNDYGGKHASSYGSTTTAPVQSMSDVLNAISEKPSLGTGIGHVNPTFSSADYSISPTNFAGAPGLNPATSRPGTGISFNGSVSQQNADVSPYSLTIQPSVNVSTTKTVNAVDPYNLAKPVTYADVKSYSDMGMGGFESLNINNPTQTADQVLASEVTHDFLNQTVPNMALGMIGTSVSPVLMHALRLAVAQQQGQLGEATGLTIGSLLGQPAVGSIAAILGRSLDTGRPVTENDLASAAYKSFANAIGQKVAAKGYEAGGFFGGKLAGAVANSAASSLGSAIGLGSPIAGGSKSSLTGGKR